MKKSIIFVFLKILLIINIYPHRIQENNMKNTKTNQTTKKLQDKALEIIVKDFRKNFDITKHTIFMVKEVKNVKLNNYLLNEELFDNIEYFNEDIWQVKKINALDSRTIETIDYELVNVYNNYFMDIQDEQIYKINNLVYFPKLKKIDV